MFCPHCGEEQKNDIDDAEANDGIAMGCGCVIGVGFWLVVGLVMYFTTH